MAKHASDAEYIGELVARGRAFTYRAARTPDTYDPTWEISRDKWIEWLAEAEATVTRLASPDSEAVRQIKHAKHLEAFGEIGSEFYESRESAIKALLLCLSDRLPRAGGGSSVKSVLHSENRSVWERYGRELLIGIVVTVVGGVILALIL